MERSGPEIPPWKRPCVMLYIYFNVPISKKLLYIFSFQLNDFGYNKLQRPKKCINTRIINYVILIQQLKLFRAYVSMKI